MAINNHIQINGKKYKVLAEDWAPVVERYRSVAVSLTGKTIINDLTVTNNEPRKWQMTLRVYISQSPDVTWAIWDDLIEAYEQESVVYLEHNDLYSHTVVFLGELQPVPRVPAAAISGDCYEVFHVKVTLQEVFE